MSRRTKGLGQFLAWSFAGFTALFVIAKCTGCFPVDKQLAAASGFEAQQLACVDRYDDRASIDACRAKVRAAWVTDAGKDGDQ